MTRSRIAALGSEPGGLCVTNQVLREYVAVVTRPTVVSRPRTCREALDDVARFRSGFEVLINPPDVHDRWTRLVEESGVTGAAIHDAFLVATAEGNGVDAILTHNGRHFELFPGMRIVPLKT